jgi:hypothetical protein
MLRIAREIVARVSRILGPPLPETIYSVRQNNLTYLSVTALKDLYDRIIDIENRNAKGAILEAGCALGGSAIVLAAAKSLERPLYVYDVFGMIPEPSSKDGEDIIQRYKVISGGEAQGIGGDTYYGYEKGLYNVVRENFQKQGFPTESNNVHLVQGLFEDMEIPDQPILLAHIDGDWYESVMTCLEKIEPHLAPNGVLVIDDYDSWSGCRKAVDDYFSTRKNDYTFEKKARLHIVKKS